MERIRIFDFAEILKKRPDGSLVVLTVHGFEYHVDLEHPDIAELRGSADLSAIELEDPSARPEDTPEQVLASLPSVSRPQMLAALVDFEIITEAEAVGWIGGTLPAVVDQAIGQLPASQQLVARLRAVAQTPVDPSDPLVAALAASKEMGTEAIVILFDYAAGL